MIEMASHMTLEHCRKLLAATEGHTDGITRIATRCERNREGYKEFVPDPTVVEVWVVGNPEMYLDLSAFDYEGAVECAAQTGYTGNVGTPEKDAALLALAPELRKALAWAISKGGFHRD